METKSCYWLIQELPGLTPEHIALLHKHCINNTKDLLERARNKEQKQALANQLGINLKYVGKWVALADLARIPSIGCQYCGLLLHSGVGSVAQLVKIPVPRLHRQILRLQVATIQRKDLCPSLAQVQIWIREGLTINN